MHPRLTLPSRLVTAGLVAASLTACGGAPRQPVRIGGETVALARAPAEDNSSAAPHAPDAPPAGADNADSAADDDSAGPDDYESQEVDPSAATRPRAPVLDLSDAEIEAKVRGDLASLGAMSIGRAHAGALVNGVPLPESPYWERVSPGASWCTEETRDYLTAALARVHARFPDSPKVFVGNVSTQHGGLFPPHVSHQSGRDVDISYYLAAGHAWYAQATAANLDFARTWAFVRALVTETDVEMLFIDRRIQLLLRNYALQLGEDPAWVDSLFQYGGSSARPLIVHVRGHATHIHIRFRSPIAEELGRRAYPFLLRRGLLRPPTYFVKHVTKKGETLSHLALRYKTTIDVIRSANGLKNDGLREGKEYRIPQRGGVASIPPVLVPPRRIPPEPIETAQGASRATR
jgi:murein endopeptidase